MATLECSSRPNSVAVNNARGREATARCLDVAIFESSHTRWCREAALTTEHLVRCTSKIPLRISRKSTSIGGPKPFGAGSRGFRMALRHRLNHLDSVGAEDSQSWVDGSSAATELD